MNYPTKSIIFPENPAYTRWLVKARVQAANKRARHYGCPGRITVEDWWEVYWKTDGACVACGDRDYVMLNHIVRLEDYGPNTKENLQVLCYECHLQKCQWEQAGLVRRAELGMPLAIQAYSDVQ
jgi:5-methylcytosine-specific restriction endonuclease McrA